MYTEQFVISSVINKRLYVSIFVIIDKKESFENHRETEKFVSGIFIKLH